MWLSRGLLASTLILAVKAQDGIEDAAMRIATGFAESLIQHAVTTLSGEAGGAGDTGDTVNAGDQGNQGNQGQGLFDASLIDAATVTHMVSGEAIVETYTRPGGQLFPVTLLPHPRITIAPTSDDPYERIIQAYTGGADATTNQEITIAEPTGTKPGTIIVDVPGSAYSSFSSGQAGALTIPPSNDHPTATVISALPSGVGITGEATRTIPAAGGASATVVIQTPWEDVPPSTPGAGAGVGGGAGGVGGDAGGSTSNVLVIQTYTGTEYITEARVSTVAGAGGDQGTVVVQVPPGNQIPGGALTIPPSGDSHYTTIVREYTCAVPISTPITRLVPTSGTQDGTIIIETPGGSSSPTGGSGSQGGNSPENQPQVIPPSGDSPYSTILRPHAGSDEITEPVTYTIPPTGMNPGTVIIETPAVRVGQSVITLPSDPGSGYITIVRPPSGTGIITAPTTITIPPSNGQPGTIVIETPAPQPGGGEITIPAGADGSFITVIRGPTGTDAVNAPTTITIAPSNGQPGTVIIETPVGSGGQTTRGSDDPFTITNAPGGQYVTVFRPHSGDPISVPITLTQPGQNGQPGTIIIETPAPTTSAPGSGPITIPAGGDSPYVTVYRPHSGSPINKPITITVPPSGGQPGTIIVETPFETPKGQNAVTSAESGGQQITIPPSKNNPYVTIYRPHTGDPITVPITITQSPSNGQPGTIIIETPAPPAQTVTQTAPGATVTVQPDTPGGYTTIYRPHTGEPITEPITVTTISGSNGQPGTVIIETQGPITVTATGPGGTATIYTPGADVSTTVTKTVVSTAPGGQPTTVVVIETPPPVKVQPTSSQVTGPDGFVTVTEQYTGTGVITAIFTTTVIASGTGPGTVYIETPPPVKFVPTTSAPETTVTGNDNYVTVFKPFPGPGIITAPITITEVAPSGGRPGTVVVQTPVSENPTTTPLPQPSTTQGTDGYVTVFLPFPGPGVITQPYTRTQAPSGGNPGTVFITTPAPLPATTTPLPEPSTTQGADGYVTVYLPYTGPGVITQPYTRTQPPSGGNPGTVFITTPAPVAQTTTQQNLPSTTSGTDGYVTVFIPYPGPGEITAPITSTQPPSGGMPGTVFITTPVPAFSTPKQANAQTSTSSGGDGYVTVFMPYTGTGVITAPITSTQAPANGQPGTVFVTTPAPAFSTPKQANAQTSTTSGVDGYVTVFMPYTGTGVITAPITSTQAPANGQPGTVFVTTPAALDTSNQQNGVTSTSAGTDGYVTVFLPFPGPGVITAPITSTQLPANGQPGTVYVTTPAPLTSEQGAPTSAQGSGDYVTVFLPYTGTGVITAPITSTQAPAGGNPGTVFITTPGAQTPIQSQSPALTTDNYITMYTPFPGPGVITAPITITKPPSNGQPGTVLIETPAPASSNADTYVTVYRPYPGPGTIAAPITLTQAPANGQPGTVFIETQPTNEPTSTPTSGDSVPPVTIPPEPTGSYVTIFRPYPGPGKISTPVTYTQSPASGQPGTVIIETPNPDAPTDTQSGPVTVPTGNNNPYVTVYKPYPGPGNIDKPITITSVTASGDQPGTIVIETPTLEVNTKFAPTTSSPPITIPADDNNYVTVYRPHTGSPITAPITVTTIAPSGGQPGTVIIETPGPESQPASTDSPPVTIPQGQDGYVTVYQPYPGPGTITEPVTVSTIAPTNGQPGTVIIQTPAPASLASSTEAQTTSASAVTIPADNGGYVTVYRPFPGPGTITAPRTVGTIAGTSGQPGTVIIETPAPQATVDEKSSAPAPAITSAQGNDGYVTIFKPYTGTGAYTGPVTVSSIPPTNGQPGTIVVETLADQATTSTQAGGNAPVTIPPSPENSYVTVYRPHTGVDVITAPVTVTTIQGENGQPGTIIIVTPAAQAPSTTEESTGAPVTIPPGPNNSYVTVYRPHRGADSITAPVTVTTIEGANGQPGTIIIETPEPMAQTPTSSDEALGAPSTVPPSPGASYITVYRPYTGTETIATPVTSTIEGTNGQPGTVIIETPVPATPDAGATTTVPPGPDSSYVTVYKPYTGTGTIAVPLTSTIEGTNGQPGTVIIETPMPATPDTGATTTVPPGPDSSYVTVYRPYTGTETITTPLTSTIEGTNGQPGTIIIETPMPATPGNDAASTAPAGPGATYVTVYQPYPGPVTTVEPSNGNPGTVIIQTPGLETGGKVVIPPVTVDPAPGEQYTTVYRPHTGTDVITAPVTVTTIAPAGGQPGTVIIETPDPETPGPNPTVTLPPGPNESYVTVFQPHTGTDIITGPVVLTTIPPANGQPGTVIIETPVASESASTPVPADSATGSAPQATPTYVTVYRPHTGPDKITAPVTITTAEPSGGQPGTVIIETPDQDLPPMTTSAGPAASYVTVYQPHTGTDRITEPVTITTIEPANGQPGTVIIETPGQQAPPVTSTPPPASYVTITRLYTGTETINEPITTTVPPQGDQPGTVIVETPGQAPLDTAATTPSYVTVTRPYTGSDQITAPIVTTVSPQGGQPGTVIYETQAPFVTVYRPHTGPDQITGPVTVSTIAPSGDQPGTIIVETPGAGPAVTTTPPAPSYVTITNLYTGTEMLTEPTTVTTIPPQGDQPGTVIVETQGTYATISTLYTGTGVITGPVPLTTIPPQGNQPGTVVVGTLGSYVTITTLYTGTDSISGPTPVTTILPQGDQPGTVVVATPPSYVTTTVPYTGVDQITAPITATTIPPQGDQPGTVIVQTQAPFATVYRPHEGPDRITAPVTVSTIAPTGGQPGTVIVETPGSEPPVTTTPPAPSYTSVYEEYTGTDDMTEPRARTTIEPQGDQPGTIIFDTPGVRVISTSGAQATYTTSYRPHSGPDSITAPVTVTTVAPQGNQPGTVIIETPGPALQIPDPAPLPTYVTVYQPHSGPDRITGPVTVTTIPPQGDQPGTVIIETPGSEPAITTGAGAAPSYVTVYQPHTGPDRITEPVTVTTVAPQGDQPGTVIIETPGSEPAITTGASAEPSYVTIYQPHAGPDRITEPVTVTTIPLQGDKPGTVIIETPGSEPPVTSGPAAQPSYVTVYRPHTGVDQITAPVTVTTVASQGDQPGTVIIETPGSEPPATSGPAAQPSYVTVYRPHTGVDQITTPVTITTIEPQGDRPGTIIIETPGSEPPVTATPDPTPSPQASYVTVYQPHTGADQITAPITITTIEPQGGQPGTVIIETPGSEPPVTATSEPAPSPQASYVTVYQPHTGAGQITAPVTVTTIEPQGGQPGTVIIETPGSEPPITSSPGPAPEASYVTIFRPHTGADQITAPITITTIEPRGGQPGTVIIETPGSQPPVTSAAAPAPEASYVTVFRPHTGADQITAPVTITTIEPQGGQPGTVIIETPGSEPPVTSSPSPAPEASYVTVFRPHTGTGTITAPVTVTTIEPQGGQPGTVVVETPGSEEPVTSTPAPSYTTIYEPHTGTGDFTGEVTRTIASPQGGQPGTVVIETPGLQTGNKGANPPMTIPAGDDNYVTVFQPHTGTPEITAPVTLTTIAPANGQPGTVIIETPVPKTAASSDSGNPPVTIPAGDDKYVTIFRPHTGADVITAPVTVTTIAPSGGQPGTVIIETPEPVTQAAPTSAAPEDVFVTIYRPYTGTDQITAPVTVTTIAPVSGTGTVIIETLAPQTASDVYVTIFRPYTGTGRITEPTTVTTIAPVAGTGTVIVETPTPEPTTDAESSSPAITIPSQDESRNVTVIRPYPGPGAITAPVTNYVPPTAAGEPGTVIIETPVEQPTTEAQPQSQPTSAAAVTIPPSDGSPNITVVREYPGPGVITAPVTSYEPPSTPGQPGTVIIETPAASRETSSGSDGNLSEPAGTNVTFYTLAPPGVKTPITSYAPPQTPGQTGTVFIQTVAPEPGMSADDGRNVTIMTDGPASLTAPQTRYQPPGSSGDPGTVIIETPGPAGPTGQGDRNVTIMTNGPASLTAPQTRYQPPGSSGDPGTVVIETPGPASPAGQGDRNVTIMTQGPGTLTAPYTRYQPPGSSGDPGTVYIETPGPAGQDERNVTVTREGPSAFTTYSPPGSAGDPGTVVIDTPPARSAEATSDAVTIPAHASSPNVTVIRGGPGKEATTIYVPPTGTEPGTIIIETPTDVATTPGEKPTSEDQNISDEPAVTIPPSSNSPNTTVIRPYPGPGSITEPLTKYVPPTAPGEPGTVIIETQTSDEPAPTTANAEITLPPSSQSPNVTVIRPYPGPGSITEPVTRYVPPTAAGEPGTVVIETQATDSDSDSTKAASSAPTEKQATSEPAGITIPANSGSPNVTIFRPYTGPGSIDTPITSYIPPANPGEPGTVVIETPASPKSDTAVQSEPVSTPGPASVSAVPTANDSMGGSTTPMSALSSNPDALTLTPSDSRDDFTIIEPNTKFAGATENVTQVIPPSDGAAGTKIIYTPLDTSDASSQGATDTDTYVTISATVTIPGDPSTRTGPKSDVGSDAGTTGAETNVIIIPPSGTEPGTVLSQTSVYLDQTLAQHGNVTITRAAPAGVTTPFTTYSPPAHSTDPGTIIVEIPDHNVTITRAGPPEITRTMTTYSPPASPGDPGTVIVETPDYNVTITTEAPKTVTALRSTYMSPGKPGDPGTVILETPIGPYNVTTTRGASTITAPFTTYSPPGEPGDPGTVIVETPDYNVTVTKQGPKTATAAFTTYSPPGKAGDPGTVIVETPADAYNVTTTRGASTITAPFTTYSPPGEPGDPGTIIIETPDYNVTITRQAPKSVMSLVSIYSPPGSPGDPGTVIIETPLGPYNVTTTRGASSVTAPVTTYLPPGEAGDPGTVLIETPEYNVTVTSEATDSGSETVTRYNPPATPGDPGTVAIIMPNQKAASTSPNPSVTDAPGQNVTVYRPGPSTLTGPVTSYIPPASSGANGTVIIETPGSATRFNVTATQTISTITAIYTTYMPADNDNDPGTIVVGVPGERNVTVTKQDDTVTAPYTSYSPPATAGDPGTVFISVPADRNVSVTSIVSTRTAPYTTYSPPANRGDPGTVVVELPPDSNVTTTKTVSDRTAPYTTFSPPANKGNPGTIIVEVPPEHNVTVTEVISTITSPYTSYSSPAKQGDPGTVFIGLPPDSNVTITTEVASRTAPYTTYSPPANKGDPGTVIVELPPGRNVTITTEVASRTAPYTRYSSPANRGDPGTVVIEMPPDSNVTITTEVATRTKPYTTYSAPANKGDPGTVIIEMPPDNNVTITTEVASRTKPYTTYAAPASKGDPGTVIVEMPPDSNVTVTTEVATRTKPYTTFAAPANKGDPGTVIVEMPPDSNTTITTEVASRTKPYTTFATPANKGDPGTVIVEMPPNRNVTITTEVPTRTAPYTTYSSPGAQGDPGTIVIELPPDRNVTVTTEIASLTSPYTSYISPSNKGDPGTVIIGTPPDRNVTTTEEIPTLTQAYTTYSPPGSRGDPGTVIIALPPARNVTTTEIVNTITRATTTYVPPANQGDPGTVIVQEPPETNTTIVEVIPTISRPATRFVPAATKGDPGTVFIDVPPNHNVTITTTVSTITRPSTTFASPATDGDAGTVLVQMPPEYNVTTTQTVQKISRPVTRYSSPAEIGDPGTVYLDLPPEFNVTITTTVPTITRQSTTFAPGATQGDPGTVIIEMPPAYNVTTTQTVSTISRPVTRYSKPGEVGDPGTIYVDLPPQYNVTITTTVPTITRQSTTFAPAGEQGDPGTVIIQMPPDTNVTTTQTVQTITRPVTRYSKPGEVGDPGTVYVDLPPEYNVTRTTTVATMTKLSTTFVPASEQGDAGTILVQMPPDTNVTTTQTISTISRPATRYSRPGSPGDPGTVYVDVPPEYNVTRTTTVATITRASTTFAPAGEQGDPGTFIVQLPPSVNVTVSSTVPTITRPATRFATPATVGDPGTVFVDVPPEYNVTTTATVSTISRARTTYNPAGEQGDPGTILVQVPPDYNVTTTETVSTISRVRTTYNPAATQGDPNTVLVQVPIDYTITTTQTVSTISRARTTYNPAGEQGDPNTVLVEVPPDYNVTTTETVSTISRVRTTYNPAGEQGDPNTVLVQVPVDYTITTTETVSTISRARTTYMPAGEQGDPNTVLVQLPPNVTTTQTVATITEATTTFIPAGTPGDPGTVLVEVPGVKPAPSVPLSGPSASLPSAGLPSATVPSSIDLPGVKFASSLSDPQLSAPSVPLTGASVPLSAPSASLPSASLPSASLPSASLPSASLPSASLPSASLPSASLPSASLPSASLPTVGLPSSTLPVAVPPVPVSSSSSTVQAPAPATSTSTSSKMPQASFGPTFDCDANGNSAYTISTLLGNTLTRVNLITGARTVIKSGVGPGGVLLNLAGTTGAINSIGFNPLDYYIYGFINQGVVGGVLGVLTGTPKSQLIRIASNGAYELLPLTVPSTTLDMGDVDEQGRLWVSESGGKWWSIDLNPKSANFGKLINSGTSATNILSGVGDWAYVPGGGDYLYAVQASIIENGLMRTNIVRWSRTTHVWERYQTYPNLVLTALNLVWGAVMAGPGGTLYAQENLLGQTWKFTLGSNVNPTAIPGGSIANLQGDGARCIALDSSTTIAAPTTTAPITITVTVPNILSLVTQVLPGTVMVQVPTKSTVTTTQTVGTITAPTTTTRIVTDLGQPDTVLVQFPTPYNVTITTAGPTTLASTATTYVPPGTPGNPGTVIVQRPPVTVTTNGGTSISIPYTTYFPPGASGDAGTVVIATPAPRSTSSSTTSRSTSTSSVAPQATVAFSCDVYGYLMQKTALYRVEITTGKTTLIKSNVGPGGWINGIGYNKFDNYIYGMHMDDTGTQLIRIGGDGGWTLLPARTNDRTINMGDIDNQGRFWISNQGEAWWAIDLMPGSATYGKIILSGTAKNTLNCADWAFVPGGGDYMYAVMYDDNGDTSTLCRFSRTTYTWQTLKAYGHITGDNLWGAAYASQDGSLYGSENSSGQIYKFPIAPTIGTPKFIAAGPVSSWNDGARCIDSQSL
ncbi:hypothetical protein LB507_000856, partial [Fusarium sp. FIESC RH6]